MARTVNPDDFAAKRGEILNVARRLILTKGYEQMSIQNILDELHISSGAFHHYFDTRAALLDAFIEDIQQELEKTLLPILRAPHLTAVQKLQGFFDTLDNLSSAHQADVITAIRIWYTDDNAFVRQKVDQAVLAQRSRLVSQIVCQGVGEGIFTATFPELAGEVILSLLQGMGNTNARQLLSLAQLRAAGPEHRDLRAIDERVAEIISTYSAYLEAIERVLGAPSNCLSRMDAESVKAWATLF